MCIRDSFKIDLNDTPEILTKLMSEDKLSKNLEEIRKTIKKSKYLVASWTTSDFDKCHDPDYIISSISDFILSMNKTSRAACMPIAGSLADATSSQTMGPSGPTLVFFNYIYIYIYIYFYMRASGIIGIKKSVKGNKIKSHRS